MEEKTVKTKKLQEIENSIDLSRATAKENDILKEIMVLLKKKIDALEERVAKIEKK